jgi:hypothetical protein
LAEEFGWAVLVHDMDTRMLFHNESLKVEVSSNTMPRRYARGVVDKKKDWKRVFSFDVP